MTRLRFLAAALGAGLGLAVTGTAPAVATTGPTASITDSCPGGAAHCFAPQTLTVAAGTTVTWASTSAAPHTVSCDSCAPGAGPSSGEIQDGGSYRFTFATPGTYSYHCDIHPSMTATVVVTGSVPTTPVPTTPAPTSPPAPRPTVRPAPAPTAPPAPGHTPAPVPRSTAPAPPTSVPTPAATPAPTATPTPDAAAPAITPAPAEPSPAVGRIPETAAPAGAGLPGALPAAAVALATVAAGLWWIRRSRSEGAAGR